MFSEQMILDLLFSEKKISKEIFENAQIKYLNLYVVFEGIFKIEKSLCDYYIVIELSLGNFGQNFTKNFLEICNIYPSQQVSYNEYYINTNKVQENIDIKHMTTSKQNTPIKEMDHWLNNNQANAIFGAESDEKNDESLSNPNLIIPISKMSECRSELLSRKSNNRSLSLNIKSKDNILSINNFSNINNLGLKEEMNNNKTISNKSKSKAYTRIIRHKDLFQMTHTLTRKNVVQKQTYLNKKKKRTNENEDINK